MTSRPNEVDIWQIDLSERGSEIGPCRCLLSADEVQRADRFYFERDRRRFIVARTAMRQILSRYTGQAPRDLCFSYGPKGKPEIFGCLEKPRIRFNLSHSSELALLAVTQGLRVGVDIERANAGFAAEDIAERFFSAIEVHTLQALASSQRAEAFFSCWTRKEAYIKAQGEGLSVPLDSFAVTFVPENPARLLYVDVDPGEIERWSMYNIEVSEGYKAALVVEGKDHGLRRLQWVHSDCGFLK